MKTTGLRPALCVAVALLASAALGGASAHAAPPTGAHAVSQGAIHRLFDDFNSAFNRHDTHALGALFTEDADFITIGGELVHGRSQIEAHMVPLYAGVLRTVHRQVSLRGIRFLRPDIATIDGDFETTGIRGPDGTAVPPARGLYDWIVERRAGRWQIVVWHESNLPPPRRAP